MPNEIHAEIIFYGPKLEEFRNDLKSLAKGSSLDIEDIYEFYHVSDEDKERTYIEDYILDEKDYVQINTWNAWDPKVKVWNCIYSKFCSDDGDEGLNYVLFAEDQDNMFNIWNTDYSGKYYSNKYKVLYSEDEDGSIFDDYEYFETLEQACSFVKKYAKVYCIFEILDDVEYSYTPLFFDSDGNEVDPPEDY